MACERVRLLLGYVLTPTALLCAAVVWDCQAGAADEAIVLLPGEGGGHKMQMDMSSYGGDKLCMAARSDLAPGAGPPTCDGLEALRFSVTQTATAHPAALRSLAVY